MMFDIRTELAAAVNTLDGVHVSSRFRQTLKPGDGFLKWAGRVPDDSGLGWIDTWQVWIGLAQDVLTAETWLADHLDLLIAALEEFLFVTSCTPAELVLGSNSVNGLIIEGTRPAA